MDGGIPVHLLSAIGKMNLTEQISAEDRKSVFTGQDMTRDTIDYIHIELYCRMESAR